MKSLSPQLLGRIGTLGQLPTLPHILLTLIGACNKERSSVQEISQIVSKDPALSAQLMGIANVARDGVQDRVIGIDQAVSLVGIDAVKNMAMNASLRQCLEHPENRPSLAWLKQLWQHSLMCAVLARSIAEQASYHSPDEAYLAGLFHDVGKLLVHRPSSWGQAAAGEQPGGDESALATLEKALGATHSEIGAEMIQRWSLRSFMADAVLYHHEPFDRIQNALPLVKFVFVANTLCSDGSGDAEARHQIVEQVIGLGQNEAEELMSRAEKELQQAAEFLEIELVPSGSSDELPSEGDELKQLELMRTVRDMSLVQGTLQDGLEVYDVESMLKLIKRGFQVLFEVQDLLLFLYNHERGVLVGESSLESEQGLLIQDVVIPVQKEKSIIAECLLEESPLDSFGHLKEVAPSVLDFQLLRLMEKDGMLCLPLTARNTYVGAVVLGADEAEAPHLLEEINLLKSFTDRAALLVYAEKVRQVHDKSAGLESLEAPSEIARKVVHEVSNPLGIIKNYLRILGPKLEEDGTGQEEIRIINEEIDRVSSIVNKLSDFSQPNIHKKESVDVNELISDLIKITHEPLLLESKIKAHFKKESSLPPIISDKDGLKQVFINLIKNAVEAMPDGGDLHIRTRSVSNGVGDQGEGLEDGEATHVEIGVRDEGKGIPESMKPRLFEPFASSKGAGHAGLGLSIAHTIIGELDGEITCESEEKKGTIFKVVLPMGRGGLE